MYMVKLSTLLIITIKDDDHDLGIKENSWIPAWETGWMIFNQDKLCFFFFFFF